MSHNNFSKNLIKSLAFKSDAITSGNISYSHISEEIDSYGNTTIIVYTEQAFSSIPTCKNYKKSFTIDEPGLMKRRARISNEVKLAVSLELKKFLSLKEIAESFDVSINT